MQSTLSQPSPSAEFVPELYFFTSFELMDSRIFSEIRVSGDRPMRLGEAPALILRQKIFTYLTN